MNPLAKCKHGMEASTCADCLKAQSFKVLVRAGIAVDPKKFVVDRTEDGGDGHGQRGLPVAATAEEIWLKPKPSQKTEKEILEEEDVPDLPEEVEEDLDKIAAIEETAITLEPADRAVSSVPEPANLPPVLNPQEILRKRQLAALPKNMEFLVPVCRIRPMPDQPRGYFDPVKLQKLGESMSTHGQRRAVEVRWLSDDPRWYCELIDGERRLRVATENLKWRDLRVIIKEVADYRQQFLMSVIANFGSEAHTPLEIANAIDRLLKFGYKPPEVAAVFGKSVGWVYSHQKLAWLDEQVKALLDPSLPWEKGLRLSVALMLVSLPAELQTELAHEVIRQNMSVNAARQYVRRRAKEAGFSAGDPTRSPKEDYRNLRSSLSLMNGRLILLLNTPAAEMKAMFEHREPDDFLEVLKEAEKLCDKIEVFKKKLLETKSGDLAEQPPLFKII